MKRTRVIIILIAVFAVINTTQAQQAGKLQLSIRHSIGIPVGSFRDVTEDISPRGGNISILYGLNDKISIGGSIGFQDFYQKNSRQVYTTSEGSEISAVLTNSVQVTPVLLTGKYNFLTSGKVQPYASIGIGGNLITYAQLLGEYTNDSRNKIGFAAKPELGIDIPIAQNRFKIGVAAAYNYMPFNYGGINNLSNVALQAGVTFPLKK